MPAPADEYWSTSPSNHAHDSASASEKASNSALAASLLAPSQASKDSEHSVKTADRLLGGHLGSFTLYYSAFAEARIEQHWQTRLSQMAAAASS